jgi:hypothetical protein
MSPERPIPRSFLRIRVISLFSGYQESIRTSTEDILGLSTLWILHQSPRVRALRSRGSLPLIVSYHIQLTTIWRAIPSCRRCFLWRRHPTRPIALDIRCHGNYESPHFRSSGAFKASGVAFGLRLLFAAYIEPLNVSIPPPTESIWLNIVTFGASGVAFSLQTSLCGPNPSYQATERLDSTSFSSLYDFILSGNFDDQFDLSFGRIFGAMELWETSVVILCHYSAYNHLSTVRFSHIEPLNGLSPPPIESIWLIIVVLPLWRSIRPLFLVEYIRACEGPIRG